MCLFDVCVCLCVCVCSGPVNQTSLKRLKLRTSIFDMHVPRDSPDIFKKRAWPGSCDPLNFWALNANSSKTVKATVFRFDVHVSRDCSDMNPLKFFGEGVCKNLLGRDMHSHEQLLVYNCRAAVIVQRV